MMNNNPENFSAAFGTAIQILKPEGHPFPAKKDHAIIVLSGSLDLFVARKSKLHGHGHAIELCPSINEGGIIPPFPQDEAFVFFGRCMPGTEIGYLPWSMIFQHPELFSAGTSRFTECIGWADVPESPENFLLRFSELCSDAMQSIARLEQETEVLIQKNAKEQKVRMDNVYKNIGSLFIGKSERKFAVNPDDPVLAAAVRTAAKSGIKGLVLGQEQDLRIRLENCAVGQRFRIAPAHLEPEWFKNKFFPTLLIAKDGSDAFCAFSNSMEDAVAWSGATGQSFVIDSQFCENIEPRAWNFFKSLPEGPLTLWKIFQYIMPMLKSSIPCVLCLLLGCIIFDLVTPVVNSMIFAEVIPDANKNLLWMLFSLLLITVLSKTFLEIVANIISWKTQDTVALPLQMAIFDHLMRLPVNFFRNEAPGEMAQKVMGFDAFISRVPMNFYISIFKILFVFIPLGMLFYYSVDLAIIVTVIFFGVFLVLLLSCYFIWKYQCIEMRKKGEQAGLLTCFVSGVSKLRSAGAETYATVLWSQKMVEQKKFYTQHANWNIVLNSLLTILPWIIFCFTTVYIVLSYLNGDHENRISVADFAGFIGATAILSGILIEFMGQVSTLLYYASTCQWIRPMLEAPEEKEPPQNKHAENSELKGAVELDNVSFAYDPEHPILKKVSLHADPGEFIAITGGSGAGKSTLLRLMLRFESPSAGSIFYDGEDIENKNMDQIRAHIGVVLQTANVLPDSILSNIIGMSSSYTEEDAWRAADMAGCADDIRGFPMKMQTLLTDSTVSGGQKQRILLAHALLRNPKVIFLDEATSALDNKSQRRVIESLQKIKATKIVIAHRLTTIMDADRIYYLEHGSILEVGTYQELMNKKGAFYVMAKRQLLENQEGAFS